MYTKIRCLISSSIKHIQYQCPAIKNLSSNQLEVFDNLMNTCKLEQLDQKQINLIVYLVQKLKPITIPYQQHLLHCIEQSKVISNQDVDIAIKILKISAESGYEQHEIYQAFNRDYDEQVQQHRIHSYVQQNIKQLSCDDILIELQRMYPQVSVDSLLSHFNQSHRPLNLCDKIKTFSPRDIVDAHNTPEQIKQHQVITGGKIVLRFPPEPNGYLHLGHVRSIRLNFHSAEQLNGICYLRYDDTNPAAEKQQFIDEIEQNVRWFGHIPTHITYASDHFQFLYDCAIKLIKSGKAYICEQSRTDMNETRSKKELSPYRNRDDQESLRIFQEMQQGQHVESKYTLRLRIDPYHCNPALRDPVIYRVLLHSHPRSGTQWKVYPMYDFAHCICDSLEHITHSLCTLEFENRRELYYWILNTLNLYKPVVYEFSRLNISHNLLSKRRIAQLIMNGHVGGWNDPRLLTLAGLQKRGYTPTALSTFIDQLSVPRSGNESITSIQVLENCLRKELEISAAKIMTTLNPVLMIINNTINDSIIDVPLNNKCKQLGNRSITLSNQVYVDRNDIIIQQQEGVFGIALGGTICLKYYGVVECNQIHMNNQGIVNEVICTLVSTSMEDRKLSKMHIHWISVQDSIDAQILEYDDLFTIPNPQESDDFMKHINPQSLTIYQGKVPKHEYEVGQRFQFERNGYYIVDNVTPLTFIKIVGLVDKVKKKALATKQY